MIRKPWLSNDNKLEYDLIELGDVHDHASTLHNVLANSSQMSLTNGAEGEIFLPLQFGEKHSVYNEASRTLNYVTIPRFI